MNKCEYLLNTANSIEIKDKYLIRVEVQKGKSIPFCPPVCECFRNHLVKGSLIYPHFLSTRTVNFVFYFVELKYFFNSGLVAS